jgi:ATP-dependent exoDNAse (exonuclease V) beta subunit
MSQLKIYRASAGSGKTFTLTKEFIFLLFKNPLNYIHTLAVTFTNKATGEMKSRILEKLYQISVNKTNDYVSDLCEEFALTEKQVRQRAHILLSYLLHDFSKFSISTIDSFFQKIIRSFAREAGLESGFKIELNTPKILQKAIDHLLMKVDLPENKHLKEWLVQFAEQKLTQGKNWNLSSDLNKLGSEIFNELFQLESRDILLTISNKEKMQQYLNDLKSIITTFELTIKKIGEDGSVAIQKSGLQYDDFTGKSRTPVKYFEKLKTLDKLTPTASLLKLIDEPKKWERKDNSSKKNDQIAEIYPLLNMLLKKAISYIDKNYETYLSAKVVTQNYYALGIIADIALEVQNICREENIFLIADSSHFLNKIIDQNETPFIYEKIGTRYNNYMIDEFQDTSKLQWLNFKPLVDNSLSEDETCLIVGDVKQSIYRWRNSDWNLLDNQITKDFVQHGNLQKTLDQNWRSLGNIIQFNNSIFHSGAKAIQADFNNLLAEHINDKDIQNAFKHKISHAYQDVFQQIPNSENKSKGHIHLKFITSEEGGSYTEKMLSQMVDKIESLINHGYSYSDICILVRKKGEGEILANALLSGSYSPNEKIIPVISNESLFLSGSTAVNFMMTQIKYLQNPNNHILKAEIILHKQLLEKSITELEIEIGNLFEYNAQKSFVKQEYKWIDELNTKRQKPLLELVEYLAFQLPENIKQQQGIFIQAFINCTNQFIKENYPDLTAFIEWWEEKGKSEAVAVPDDQDAVKIMTIHKSKGLEFKVVLLPFCNWKLDAEINNNTIWCRPSKAPFDTIKLLPITYSSKLKDTIFKEDYFQERLYQYVDSLNMLYVAFTRSCEALITYGPSPSKSNKNGLKNVSDLLFFCLENAHLVPEGDYLNLNDGWNFEDQSFEYGELPVQGSGNTIKSEIKSEILQPFSNTILNDETIAIKTDSSEYFNTEDIENKVNYGKIMHEAFEYIITKDDVEPALTRMVFEGKISELDKVGLINSISELITQPNTKEWFNAKFSIKTENTILTANGSYRPDRVIFMVNQVHIVDYKFGEHEEKKYESQIIRYIQQLKSMGYSNIKGFIWYVTLNKIVTISPEALQGKLF